MEKLSQNDGSASSAQDKQQSTRSVWTKKSLIARLKKGPEARAKFVESQIINEVVFQIRALRHRNGWSQPALAEKIGTTQNQIYRLENTQRARPTITTLEKIAAAFDVGLVVRFVPFGEMIDYLTGTPRLDRGISTERKRPLSFCVELPLLEASKADVDAVYKENTPPGIRPQQFGLGFNVIPIEWWKKFRRNTAGVSESQEQPSGAGISPREEIALGGAE